MNKHIASQLNEVARTMPIVFEWRTERVPHKGWELNLTPLADGGKFNPDDNFLVEVPVMVAVEHKQQIKDAYKRGGLQAVKEYHQSVMAKYKACTTKIKLPE